MKINLDTGICYGCKQEKELYEYAWFADESGKNTEHFMCSACYNASRCGSCYDYVPPNELLHPYRPEVVDGETIYKQDKSIILCSHCYHSEITEGFYEFCAGLKVKDPERFFKNMFRKFVDYL